MGARLQRARPLASMALALACIAPAAAAPTPQEYISGFVLYVRWPDDPTIKAWQVCVAAPASPADAQYADLVVRERAFAVRHVGVDDSIGSCQVLDLTAAAPAATAVLLKAAQAQRGLLTVGEGRDFCSSGGMICLRQHDAHGGFEINLSAVKNSGFSINARLLMMARPADAPETPP